MLVDAGQRVRQGQPLLLVRTNDFVDARNGLFAARASYQNAQAQLATATRNAERQRLIYQTAGGAQKDYQQAQTDLAAAQATARTAAAALGAARDKLAVLGKSPAVAAGIVIKRSPGPLLERAWRPSRLRNTSLPSVLCPSPLPSLDQTQKARQSHRPSAIALGGHGMRSGPTLPLNVIVVFGNPQPRRPSA